MRNVFLFLACLACRGFASRVRARPPVRAQLSFFGESHQKPLRVHNTSHAFQLSAGDELECLRKLTALVIAFNPAVAFHHSGLGMRFPGSAGRTGYTHCSESKIKPSLRLDKLLAERGVGSRKDVDRMIRKGLVEIDGEVVPKTGGKMKVPWDCIPFVDGFDYPPPPLLAAYCKPLGVVSTMSDERGRADLSAVLPDNWRKLLKPVGRLDADTSGLLLFSRDGDLAHRLLHPKYGVEREYIAEVEGTVDAPSLGKLLEDGVQTIERGFPFIVQAKLVEAWDNKVRLIVTEGKHRMVRRILHNAGHPVIELQRVRYGKVRLEDLDIDEDESTAIEGEALEWALGLLDQKETVQPLNRRPRKEQGDMEDDEQGDRVEDDLEDDFWDEDEEFDDGEDLKNFKDVEISEKD